MLNPNICIIFHYDVIEVTKETKTYLSIFVVWHHIKPIFVTQVSWVNANLQNFWLLRKPSYHDNKEIS